MSGNKGSTLVSYANAWVDISIDKEACPLNTAPTSSTTLTMALGDALAVALMIKKGFKKEDFASFHPGGALGRKLFVKISDLLRKDNLPIITDTTLLKDAIITMSEGKLGTVLIVNKDDKIEAILSDGDLRRALMKDDFDINTPAINYATKNPKTYSDESLLASEALEIIEDAKIQLLLITEESNHIKGVLHIHDLINAGIKK
jgi:arabinose-5-phosphate isomerase